MRILALTLILFAGTEKLFPQIPLWQWAVQIASPGNETAWDLCADSSGNLHVGGSYDGNLSLVFGVPFLISFQKDAYVANYSPSGTFQWAIRIGGTGDDEIKGIVVSPAGDIYVTGYFEGTTDFDPGLFSTYLLTSTGGRDGFLAKYSSTGALDWAVRFGGSGNDEGAKIAVNSTGVFVTGFSQPSAVFRSTNGTTLSAVNTPSNENYFVARYSPAGVVQWVAGGGSSGADAGKNIVCDNSRVFVTGDYLGDLTAFHANGTQAATVAAQTTNKYNVFIASYDLNGSMSWISNACSSDDDFAGGLAQDSARIYVAGSFKNSTMYLPYPSPTHTIANAGGEDIFLVSITKSNGGVQWVSQQTGSTMDDERALVAIKQPGGNIVVGGSHKGLLSYAAVGGPTVASAGNEDIFVSAFDDNGLFVWNTAAGGGNIDSPYGLATSSTGAVYVCGEHANGISFGLITLLNFAGKNTFLAKTGCENVTNNTITGSQTVCAGSAPLTLTGSVAAAPGGGTVAYVWQQSTDKVLWGAAAGANTAQNYTPLPQSASSFFRRVTFATGTCSFATNVVTVTVDQPPTTAIAGNSLAVCSLTAPLSGNTPATGSGSWSVTAGSGSVISATSAVTSVTGLQSGNNILVWTISNGICPASSSTLLIRRDLPPGPAQVAGNQTVCAASVTLAALVPTTGIGSWSISAGTGSIAAAGNATTGVSGLPVGTSGFSWLISNGVCPPASASLSVQRDANPGPLQVSPDQTVCSTSATISAVSPSVGTGSWSVPVGAASVVSPASATTPVTNLQVGSNQIVWTVTNGICPPGAATTHIQRDATPGPVTPGTSQTICAASVSLGALSPTSGIGSWSLVTGGGNFSNAASPVTTVTSLTGGTNIVVWAVTNGVCAAASATYVIQRDHFPGPATAGASQTVCSSNTTISAISPTAGAGTWTVAGGPATPLSPSSPQTQLNNLQTGSNIAVWTVTNGVCQPVSDTLLVNRLAEPGPALAGTDQVICTGQSTLSAGVPTAGTGAWSHVAGQATLANINSGTTAVSVITGTNVFVWTVSNGICSPASDTISIIRDAMPDTPLAGPSQTLCSSTASIAANTPLTGQGSWSVVTGNAIVAAPLSASTSVSSLAPGNNVLMWTIINGVCPALTDTLEIFRDEEPSDAFAGSDKNICATSFTLTAQPIVTGSGNWYALNGSPTIATPSAPVTDVSGLSAGENRFEWKVFNGTCPARSDTVVIHRDVEPDQAEAGTNQAFCGNSITVSGNQPITGSADWLIVSGRGSLTGSLAAATLTAAEEGIFLLRYSIKNGICPPSSDSVQITFYFPPGPAFAGNDTLVCADAFPLSALSPTAGQGEWSLTGGGGKFSDPSSPTSFFQNVPVGETTLRWTVSNGICETIADDIYIKRDTVSVIANAGNDIETELLSLRLNASLSQWPGRWEVITGSGTIADPDDPNTLVRGLSAGENRFSWTITQGDCGSTSDVVQIRVLDFMIPNAISPNGDGRNDSFYITGLENYRPVQLQIFNRWGSLVFENSDYLNNWEGTGMRNEALADDTYYYTIAIPGKGSYSGFITVKRR